MFQLKSKNGNEEINVAMITRTYNAEVFPTQTEEQKRIRKIKIYILIERIRMNFFMVEN